MSEARTLGCPACGGTLGEPRLRSGDRLHGTPGAFAVAVCARCGSGRTLPPVSDAQLAVFYPDEYGPTDDRMSGVARTLSWLIRRWQGYIARRSAPLRELRGRTGRGLDVGCGRGELAAVLQRHGWTMTGVEPSTQACEAARGRGVDARVGTLASVELAAGAYDAAIFRHSLEHTNDPVEDLRRAAAALRPGGHVLVTVPNFGCWQARAFGSRWYHLDLPRHRVHFTADGLRAALEAAGFGAIELSTSTSAVGLAGSIQYRLAGRCLFPGGLGLRVAVGLAAMAQPVAMAVDRLTGGGDQLHAVASISATP